MTATGRATRFGDIAARLAARAPETEFERGTRRFGFLIMRTVVFLVLFVLLVNIFLRRDPLESLLFAVALAVGLTPEFLPMITSVTLSRGAVRMARRKVIVKHLAAIQNFGSIDILCSDKTGTLTSGDMTLERCCDARGAASPRALELARLNSAFQTGIRSPLDAAMLADPTWKAAPARSSTRCRSTSSAAGSPWSSKKAEAAGSSPRALRKASFHSAWRRIPLRAPPEVRSMPPRAPAPSPCIESSRSADCAWSPWRGATCRLRTPTVRPTSEI